MSTMTATSGKATGMTKDERFVILASSLGTVFEGYDFYLYGSLASIIGAQGVLRRTSVRVNCFQT